MTKKDQIKELIKLDKTDEALILLDRWFDNMSDHSSVILLQARLERYKKESMLNLEDKKNLSIEKNSINNSIFSLVANLDINYDNNEKYIKKERIGDGDIVFGDKKILNIIKNKKVKINF